MTQAAYAVRTPAMSLKGKTVVVTGSNTGIGKVTALELAKLGAHVILACRNAEKAEEARRDIVAASKNEDVVFQSLDLSSLKSIKKFAEDFNASESRLDILVNNAGLWTEERKETADGFEMQFGTNHLGHFYLTYLLLDKLKASAPSRVVTVSSVGHQYGKLDFDDLQLQKSFGELSSYGKSKTANILFTVHLAKVLEGTGVTAYSLHPGLIQTELARNNTNCVLCCFKCCDCFYLTAEQGARTTLYCCLEPSIAQHSGRYYADCKEARAKSYATDPAIAERLWRVSMELCKLNE